MTVRLKRKKRNVKSEKIEVRVNSELKHKIKLKALLYCDGNMSELILDALENYMPRRENLDIEAPSEEGASRRH